MAYGSDIWDRDLPPIRVSGEGLAVCAQRYPLPARMALGRIMTIEEFENKREGILAKPLP